MGAKDGLRKELKELREKLGAEERGRIDAAIAGHVKNLPQYAVASHVFTYLSVGDEVDTREIIRDAWSQGKTIAVPRCVPGTRTMEWHVIEGFDNLEPGSFGIEEPPADPGTLIDPASAGPLDIALVPALSFDAHGFRLGYGGGFYDVFLPTFAGIPIGLCRNAQMSSVPLPTDITDVPVPIVVTETGIA